jgi:hypothetical protein
VKKHELQKVIDRIKKMKHKEVIHL